MSKFLTPGVIAGLLSAASALSVAFGKPALGAILADPSTAATVTTVASAAAAVVAGVMQGVKKPAA